MCLGFFLIGEMMIRKWAFVVGGVAAGGVAAFAALSGNSPLAQQASSGADSITAPIIAAADSSHLRGPRSRLLRHDITPALQSSGRTAITLWRISEPGIPSSRLAGRYLSRRLDTPIRRRSEVCGSLGEKKPIEWSGALSPPDAALSSPSVTFKVLARMPAPPARDVPSEPRSSR